MPERDYREKVAAMRRLARDRAATPSERDNATAMADKIEAAHLTKPATAAPLHHSDPLPRCVFCARLEGEHRMAEPSACPGYKPVEAGAWPMWRDDAQAPAAEVVVEVTRHDDGTYTHTLSYRPVNPATVFAHGPFTEGDPLWSGGPTDLGGLSEMIAKINQAMRPTAEATDRRTDGLDADELRDAFRGWWHS